MSTTNYNLLKYFIGPAAENMRFFKNLILKSIEHHKDYRSRSFKDDEIAFYKNLPQIEEADREKFENVFNEFLKKLEVNTRSFHPRYFAQMTKDASIPALVGMFTGSLFNPNNHAFEGGPATTEMEMEVIEMIKKMAGFKKGWGHLTSGGSLANTEALWAVRDFHKKGKVLFSKGSHYSWKRICSILKIEKFEEINVDNHYRIDLNHLEKSLKKGKTMLVMANLGTTGCGAIDDIETILEFKNKYGFHLHIDAAYGGFFRSVIINSNNKVIPVKENLFLNRHAFKQIRLLDKADSITIDPHKHGLMPYGAGAVIYKDENLRKVILHTSPYTYHKTDKPNIGTFSLEGSRPGAIAAACWLTYNLIPLNNEGLGKIISESLKTASEFNKRIGSSNKYKMLTEPDLDLVCFYRYNDKYDQNKINEETLKIYQEQSIENPNCEFVFSKLIISRDIVPNFIEKKRINDQNLITLRAVFMKHWMLLGENNYLDKVIKFLEEL